MRKVLIYPFRKWMSTCSQKPNYQTIEYYNYEKNSITTFYLGFDQHSTNQGLAVGADTLILVHAPHSWYYNDPDKSVSENYTLLKTYYVSDKPSVGIWGSNNVYPEGKLLCK